MKTGNGLEPLRQNLKPSQSQTNDIMVNKRRIEPEWERPTTPTGNFSEGTFQFLDLQCPTDYG